MSLPTDDQMRDNEFRRLNEATDYDDRSGGRASESEIEALMKMVKSRQKPIKTMNFGSKGKARDGRFKGFTKNQVYEALNKVSK